MLLISSADGTLFVQAEDEHHACMHVCVARIGVLQQLLAKELNVLAVDVDILWLRDPFETLEPDQSDFLMSVDSAPDASDGSQKPCAGVIFARATDASRCHAIAHTYT